MISGITIAAGTYMYNSYMKEWRKDREMVIWDYIKKHPEDFPEVFNRESFFSIII